MKNHDGLLDQFDELAARRDAGIHSQFNGGMFVLEPRTVEHESLNHNLEAEDQNKQFGIPDMRDDWRVLPWSGR